MGAQAGKPSFKAGTVVTSDYLPWARVLSTSFTEHNPGSEFVVLVLDDPTPDQMRDDDPFELVGPEDVGLDPVDFQWLATVYDGFELSCALKPWLLRFLLEDADAALYLDSDILVCASLDDIAQRASETGLVLSPHRLEPPPADGLQPDEDTFLRLGQFNGGFLAVGRAGHGFLDWWQQRLVRECVHFTPDNPLRFVDQRWLDLTVNYFEVDVLRDRGANVAYWNLDSRRLEHGAHGYTVDGEPLRFMHFSGFDPSKPQQLTKHPARVEASRYPALTKICSDYAALVRDADAGQRSGRDQPPSLAAAIVLTPPVRAALRATLADARSAGAASAPDPRDAGSVLAWLHEPATPGGTSRYLMGLHASHEAVRREFGEVPGADEPRYQGWASTQGVALGLVPARPVQEAAPSSRLATQGALAATSALVVSIERAVDVVLEFASAPGDESLAVAVAPERIAQLAQRIETEAHHRGVALDADISLVECSDADELAALLGRADRTIDSGCPLLQRATREPVPVHAGARRKPLEFLMVNTYPSNPARHGGGMRIGNLWGSMPADVGARAVVLSHSDGGAALMPFTRARPGFEQHVAFWPELRTAIEQLRAVTQTSCDDVALALAATGDDPFTRALRAAVGAGADAVVLSHPFMVRQARALAPHLPIVYEAHNVEADLKAAMFPDDENGRKAAELVVQLEAEACSHASLVVCCTEDDRRRLIERYGVAGDIVHVVPNGASVACAAFTPWAERQLDSPRCVFAGSGHAPNLESAAIIIEAARSLPAVEFDLIGDLAGQLRAEPMPANVVLHGRVSDAEKQRLFAQATLALNPMKVGSGSNLKLVDYLAAGLPVLSSAVGARGFSPELVDCLETISPDPAALAQAIERGLAHDWSAATDKARQIVESEYDWRVISARYAELLHQTFDSSTASAEAA